MRQVAERINWRVEDLIGGEKRLDFTRPFLPESLARVEPLTFLTPVEKLALNHIRANGYLHIFGVVEEFVVPFVLKHVEAENIHLFRRFKEEFEQGFGTPCELIGPSNAIGDFVLAHDPLAVALLILHIEWMTQRHYDSVARNEYLDARFRSLLKHHWMEEAHHAKLDTFMVETFAAQRTPDQVARAVDEYLQIAGFLDVGFGRQVALDEISLERATGRLLTAAERRLFAAVQIRALRWTYLGSGMTHPRFLETVAELDPAMRDQIEEIAPAFC